jgi:hypothetical protein
VPNDDDDDDDVRESDHKQNFTELLHQIKFLLMPVDSMNFVFLPVVHSATEVFHKSQTTRK